MEKNPFASLPSNVVSEIREQIRDACAHAPTRYRQVYGKEDAITGAFGQVLVDKVKGKFSYFGMDYKWETSQMELRAQGSGAPEKRVGADAVIELAVFDSNNSLILLKCLPMQAKKEWDAKDALLGREASRLSQLPGDGIVVDYRASGYSAVRASVAAKAQGDRRLVLPDDVKPLDKAIADDFFDCSVGSFVYYYDDDAEALVPWDLTELARLPKIAVKRRIRMKVAPARWDVDPLKFGSFPPSRGGGRSDPMPTPSVVGGDPAAVRSWEI